jgi:hypothetical protein
MSKEEYDSLLDDFKATFPDTNVKNLCTTSLDQTNQRYPYQMKICQSHEGNLFEHSQWSALQIVQWFNERNDIILGVDKKTAVISAFFHDIGKGGDCIKTCKNSLQHRCWLDMYSPEKYEGKGEAEHPVYSRDMILGKRMFKLDCSEKCDSNCEININHVLKDAFPDININEVALAAEMHWEFGRINIGEYTRQKILDYLASFEKACKNCNLKSSQKLLRLCIVVACADITAGTNKRLLPSVNHMIPSNTKYLGKDPWVAYGMVSKYLRYQADIIELYNSTSNPNPRRMVMLGGIKNKINKRHNIHKTVKRPRMLTRL